MSARPEGIDVPTYQYQCTDCGTDLEVRQSFSDDALTVCPECDGVLRKVFNAVGVVFKGSGFYRNDSRNASSTSTVAASKSDSGSKTPAPATSSSGSADSGSSKSSSNGSSSSGSSSSSTGKSSAA